MQRVLLLIALAGAAGCSYTFDGEDPDLPLVGAPPSLSSLVRLNDGPVASSVIVRGKDAAYWLALQLQGDKKSMHLIRLSEPAAQTTLTGDQFLATWRAFFIWKLGDKPADPAAPTPATLSIISAGQDPDTAETFQFDGGMGTLLIGGVDDVFVYSLQDQKLNGGAFEIYQRGNPVGRRIPLIDPTASALNGSFFSGDGKFFFERGPCTDHCATTDDGSDPDGLVSSPLRAHATTEERDIDLGQLPQRLVLYEPSPTTRQFIVCSHDGLRTVPLEPSDTNSPRMLDDTACASELFSLQRVKQDDGSTRNELYYLIGSELRHVPLDGSAPPQRGLDLPVERVLSIYDPGLIVYSQDPSSRYIYGVGDGWIGDWRFMNRGRQMAISEDRSRVRFLENAARSGGIGDLTSAPMNGTGVRLARNVYQYDVLIDDRLLAAANHAFLGAQNRIVVIDEQRHEARWVVDQASSYGFIPGTNDLLVNIVTGDSTFDLVRVPIPPAE